MHRSAPRSAPEDSLPLLDPGRSAGPTAEPSSSGWRAGDPAAGDAARHQAHPVVPLRGRPRREAGPPSPREVLRPMHFLQAPGDEHAPARPEVSIDTVDLEAHARPTARLQLRAL